MNEQRSLSTRHKISVINNVVPVTMSIYD
ncbi:uncharacterized protein METZ01_LOCUS421415, partial [marine metagenome]